MNIFLSQKPSSLFIFAGEKSGDLHGSRLIRSLKEIHTDLQIEGVAGPDMRAEGVCGPLKMEDFEVMGITDVLFSLPKLIGHFKRVLNYILETSPAIVILIDYPGFNLRLAKALRKKGYKGKIVQYVSPTVWAHGKERIDQMAQTLDLLLTIYPFESKCFIDSTLKVEYVGNPLCQYIKEYPYDLDWKYKTGIPSNDKLIALFPGSRKNEIKRNLPLILKTAEKILEHDPHVIFGLSIANEESLSLARDMLSHSSKPLQLASYFIPKKYTYELMQKAHTAIAKSGTVTLELALHKCPSVILYELTFLNKLYAKYILKLTLSHFCIVNILAAEEIFPELIQKKPTLDSLYQNFMEIDREGAKREHCLTVCKTLIHDLKGNESPSVKAAKAILKLLNKA